MARQGPESGGSPRCSAVRKGMEAEGGSEAGAHARAPAPPPSAFRVHTHETPSTRASPLCSTGTPGGLPTSASPQPHRGLPESSPAPRCIFADTRLDLHGPESGSGPAWHALPRAEVRTGLASLQSGRGPLARCPSRGSEVRLCKEHRSPSLVGARPSPTHPCLWGGGTGKHTR
ncbi:hypothetical protein HJG60_011092 [Phyllostomus discolor]|uniref:Uncharacterized protein n=1 Tax=Phyllostomus discolor TaxID=89673 RepID=A0A833ZWX5_9CHIR|nr:hypothetical protein HJG60_011092 [Phyllostomus discolor]